MIYAGDTILIPKEVPAPVDNPDPSTGDPDPVITDPGPGTGDPDPVITEPGSGTGDPDPVITEPSNSINVNGYTISGNFYPVFQNYQGTLGNPISDVNNYNGASYQLFENGSIVSSQYGTFPLYGGIRQAYKNTGGLEGWLGEPKSGEIGHGNGNIIQYFEDGYIYWNGSKATAYRYGTTLPKTPTNIDNQLGVTKPISDGNNSGGNTGNDTNPESGGNNGGSNPGGGNPGGDTTIISPGYIISTINFDLKNQSIWSGGQGSSIGGSISDKFNPEWPFGLAKASLEASYNFSAFANAGTFGVNIPTTFDINWQPNPDGKSVAVNFSSKLNSGLSLETLSGFDLSAKLNLAVKLSTTLPEPWPNRTIGFEASGGLDLQSAMKAAKLPIVLDSSLQTNKKNEDAEHSIETEDVAFQAIDIVNTLALIPATSAAAIPIRDGGFLGASIGLNIQQKSKFDVTGFEIDYDGQKNGNELIVNLNNSGTLNVPIPDSLKAGQEFKFTPTIKPLTKFQSFFNLGGKIEASLNSKKLFESAADKLPIPDWLKNQVKEALPGVSLKESLETPYLSVWQGKIFNPFDFTSAFQLSEINIKIS
ncbi:MAG: hypothetical protein HC849_23845 [Oscillatoriales cyanobacterium RU_3_3]|nr:hypothetical protein [Oscillatoriales cyanobacterium RU_3_3]